MPFEVIKFIILFLGLNNILWSVVLEPVYSTIDSKRKKNTTFNLKNPTKDPIAVQISAFEVIDTHKKFETRKKTNKISFYPTQVIINPLEEKKLRIRYNGSSLPTKEEVFRIIAKELNIDVSDKEKKKTNKIHASIKMRFSYEGLLFVHKENAQANLHTTLLKHSKNGVDISVTNTGTKSIYPTYDNCNFIINHKKKLTRKDLKNTKFKRVLPEKKYMFYLRGVHSVSSSSIKSIELKPKEGSYNKMF